MKLSFNNSVVKYSHGQEHDHTTKKKDVHEFTTELLTVYGVCGTVTPILPESVRWISCDGKKVILERPPTTVRVVFHQKIIDDYDKLEISYNHSQETADERDDYENGEVIELSNDNGAYIFYEIPLPWQVYRINLDTAQLRMYFRNSSISSLNDELFYTPMPNTGANGVICLGELDKELGSQLSGKSLSITQRINIIINSLWTGNMNDDIQIVYDYLPEELRSNSDILESVRSHTMYNVNYTSIQTHDEIYQLNNDVYANKESVRFVRNKTILDVLSQLTVDEVTSLNWQTWKHQKNIYTVNDLINSDEDIHGRLNQFPHSSLQAFLNVLSVKENTGQIIPATTPVTFDPYQIASNFSEMLNEIVSGVVTMSIAEEWVFTSDLSEEEKEEFLLPDFLQDNSLTESNVIENTTITITNNPTIVINGINDYYLAPNTFQWLDPNPAIIHQPMTNTYINTNNTTLIAEVFSNVEQEILTAYGMLPVIADTETLEEESTEEVEEEVEQDGD